MVEPTGDHLDDTVDYRELKGVARRAIEDESHQLLETVARSVVAAVRVFPRVQHVRARVHKPAAATSLGVADVAVEAEG
jgi:dihydroneopterin aldolase